MGRREGPAAAAAVYEFAIESFPDFAPLRVPLAVEFVKAGRAYAANIASTFRLEGQGQLTSPDGSGTGDIPVIINTGWRGIDTPPPKKGALYRLGPLE